MIRFICSIILTLVVAVLTPGLTKDARANECMGTPTGLVASVTYDSGIECGSWPTPYIIYCVPAASGSGAFLVVWSNGVMYFNPWGCW